jgi:hypothetical protein
MWEAGGAQAIEELIEETKAMFDDDDDDDVTPLGIIRRIGRRTIAVSLITVSLVKDEEK